MISRLRGQLIEQTIGRVVIDINGFGVEVLVSATADSPLVGDQINLYTKLVVREDSLTLFGFNTEPERRVFELLCSVSGVGPKSALAVLSSLDVSEIENAVRSENDEVFRKVSGIGPKTAKLICVSLASKLPKLTSSQTSSSSAIRGTDVALALISLGWKEADANKAASEALANHPETSDSALLRIILRQIGATKTSVLKDE